MWSLFASLGWWQLLCSAVRPAAPCPPSSWCALCTRILSQATLPAMVPPPQAQPRLAHFAAQGVLRNEVLKVNELLRHFWACMPATTPARREHAERLAAHLRSEHISLKAHTQVAPGTAQQVYVSLLLRPLAAAVRAALARLEEEQQRPAGG